MKKQEDISKRFENLPKLENVKLRSKNDDVVIYGFSLDGVLVYKDGNKFTCPWLLNHALRSFNGFDSLETVKNKFEHYLLRDISTLDNMLLKKVEIQANIHTIKDNKVYLIKLTSAIATYYSEKTKYNFNWGTV